MHVIRQLILLCLVSLASLAQAQRVPVPLMNWENIPVSLSTDAPLTADQVRQAFMNSALATNWLVTPIADGQLEARYNKQDKHLVVVGIRYDARQYSVHYVRSENMAYTTTLPSSYSSRPNVSYASAADNAADHQRRLFAHRPEMPFAKEQPLAFVHPFYEAWVYDLLAAVRLNLQRAP